ncbi:hypothetical protein [Chitinophaga caseinilytica]|uniref:Lipoprotein n=1 Tax=Chitinophaga caseinilytica TaxID=2267521 RepID=A0ABZ2Z4I6_9BACT
MIKWTFAVMTGVSIFLASCATSMTPSQINRQLPNLTTSTYLTQTQAQEKIKSGKCKYLVKNREYVAPIGLTTKQDLKYGAKGIDEWVILDGGNAYVLKNFKWVTVDNNGSTQLHIDFDTMLCD